MERTSTNRRRGNRTGIEENTLAIVESTEAKDTQDADDDSTSLSIPSFLFVSPETLKKSKKFFYVSIWRICDAINVKLLLVILYVFLSKFIATYLITLFKLGISFLEAVRASSFASEVAVPPTK